MHRIEFYPSDAGITFAPKTEKDAFMKKFNLFLAEAARLGYTITRTYEGTYLRSNNFPRYIIEKL